MENNVTISDVTPDLLARSVIAVPPLARRPDYALDREGNRRILAHLAQGQVTSALYGGNANLYNMGCGEFGEMLDLLEEVAPDGSWIIPSIGADYGKAVDQIDLLKGRALPTAMVLPLGFPATPAGVATGIRRLADRYGRPLIAYVKQADYITPADLAALVNDGAVCAVKYALVRTDPGDDTYLGELVQRLDPSRIVSGIGERPAIVHVTKFGLNGFTSGSVCVAPAMSAAMLDALKSGRIEDAAQLRESFLPLEDLRDGYSPLRVLHAAVAAAGIVDTGPLLPFLSNLDDEALLDRIRKASAELLAADLRHRRERAAT
jgi:dihydrodipicolinate synthase/N-acetylneuraminate lyase